MRSLTLATSLTLLFGAAQAAPLTFEHRDWSLGCDNTGRCEAVGYQAAGEAIALSLQRDAGPGTLLRATLIIEGADEPPSVRLTVGTSTATIAVGDELPAAQAKALVRNLLDEDVAIARHGKRVWKLSLAGLRAVLLKMDEAQGRLDTPGALVRTGKRPERAVPRMVAAPKLLTQPVPRTTGSDEKLLPDILKALPSNDCQPDIGANLGRLTATKLLVMRECHRGAYQSSWDLWVVNGKPPFAPTLLHLPVEGKQESVTELIDPSFADGVLSSYAKGRGLNDCGESSEWLWTASGFQLLSRSRAIMCRDIPGGVPVSLWTAEAIGARK